MAPSIRPHKFSRSYALAGRTMPIEELRQRADDHMVLGVSRLDREVGQLLHDLLDALERTDSSALHRTNTEQREQLRELHAARRAAQVQADVVDLQVDNFIRLATEARIAKARSKRHFDTQAAKLKQAVKHLLSVLEET